MLGPELDNKTHPDGQLTARGSIKQQVEGQ